jgi:NAD(P)-dependent dehydrogenase (short-subunit alcohol dehydrogenase family)
MRTRLMAWARSPRRLNDRENSMQGFRGKVAAITGAGSGIGRALAIQLADAGANVAISDINAEGLTETAALLTTHGHAPLASQLDVTEREAVLAYADTVAGHFGTVNQIYNYAGELTARAIMRRITSGPDLELG